MEKNREKTIKLQDLLSDRELDTPHQKAPLTTRIGRLVERASYTDLLVLACIILATSTACFFWGSKHCWLTTSNGPLDVGFLDALYFSIVTFTSLGYGDIYPQGFGRIIACVVVLCGLVTVALLVGKFASERQQALLLLIYTSDCQRRIDDFTTLLDSSVLELQTATDANDRDHILLVTKALAGQLEAARKYLIFNANQAGLISFGNASALKTLYRTLEMAQRACVIAHRSPASNQVIAARTLAMSDRLTGLMSLMARFHRSASSNASYLTSLRRRAKRLFVDRQDVPEVSAENKEIAAIALRMKQKADSLNQWARTTLTLGQLEAVWQVAPSGMPQSWPKHINKLIANELSISNSLAQKCLDALLACGRLPKR